MLIAPADILVLGAGGLESASCVTPQTAGKVSAITIPFKSRRITISFYAFADNPCAGAAVIRYAQSAVGMILSEQRFGARWR